MAHIYEEILSTVQKPVRYLGNEWNVVRKSHKEAGTQSAAGFFKSELTVSTKTGSALIVFYSTDLEGTQSKIKESGGSIIKNIFSFPGGRRFHFTDLNGNEYAVWAE